MMTALTTTSGGRVSGFRVHGSNGAVFNIVAGTPFSHTGLPPFLISNGRFEWDILPSPTIDTATIRRLLGEEGGEA